MARKSYKIPVYWQMRATVTVEADSLEEAIEMAQEDTGPLPADSDYVDDSYEADAEGAYALNGDDDDYVDDGYEADTEGALALNGDNDDYEVIS